LAESFALHFSGRAAARQDEPPLKVTLGGIFVKEFCYTSGNHGSVWTKFCSPSKTTKLVPISIGLPERVSNKMQLLKEPAFYVNVFNLSRRTVCPNWTEVTWAGL